MERALGFVLGLALLVGSAGGAGCAGDPEDPAPFARMEEDEADAELRALDFGSDELVGDEGTDDELADPNLILPEENREGLAAEDLSELTDLDDLEADDGVDDELTGDAPPAPLSPASLSPASFGASSPVPSASPLGVPTDRTWFAQKFACQGNAKNCVCRGSRHNCQFPSSQPGRNRHLPGDAVKAARSVTGKQTRKLFITALGKWGIHPGTVLRDGRGAPRGVVSVLPFKAGVVTGVTEETSSNRCFTREGNAVRQVDTGFPCVRINAGQAKRMTVDGKEQDFVYAFSARLDDGTNASGWIPRASIRSGEFHMRASSPVAGREFAATKYVVKGIADYPCAPWEGETPCVARWRLKVRPRSELSRGEDLDDYLLRPGEAINLLYQTPLLGGASTDTFLVPREGLEFKRVKSRDSEHRAALRVRLYRKGGTRPVGTEAFVFGSIGGRFGWIAASAVKKGSVQAAAANSCGARREGWHCDMEPNTIVHCSNGKIDQRTACPTARCKLLDDGVGAECSPLP